MTIKFSAGDDAPVDLVAVTSGYLNEAAEELARVLARIREGELAQTRNAEAAVKSLRDAFDVAMIERGRVDKLRKQVAGTVGTQELDLEAARDEVGRRLALLRNAGPG